MLKDAHFNMVTRILSVLLMTVVWSYSDAHAQGMPGSGYTGTYNTETPRKVSRAIMRAEANRTINLTGRYGTDSAIAQKFSLPPLPGDQSFADSNNDPERFWQDVSGGGVPDIGANSSKNPNIILPPMKGLRSVLDSPVTVELLKQLTSSQSAVLMQTYMMVENGAATGFMGSMNIGTGLLSNLIQTQDYQLKLLEASDDTGKMKKAYVARVAREMITGANKDSWPAALYIASGEDGKPLAPNSGQMMNLSAGADPYDLSGLTGVDKATAQKFTDILFIDKSPGSNGPGQSVSPIESTPYKNEQLNALKEDFRALVGDIEIKMTKMQGYNSVRTMDLTFIPPAFDKDQKRRGVAAVNWEEVKVVWENLHTILFEYCQWKQKNKNTNAEVFQMETETTTADIGKKINKVSPWELASSPDIPLTMNVVQMLYRLYDQANAVGQSESCSALQLKADGIPDDEEAARGSASNLNDCGPGKGCFRNRVALQISYLIARSRTFHTYRALFALSSRFVTDPFTADLLAQVSSRAFAGMNIEDELKANYARYTDLIGYMAEFAQGNSGAGSFVSVGSGQGMNPGKS